MTPDYDGWGRVLQLFSPEDAGRKIAAAPRRTSGSGRRSDRRAVPGSSEAGEGKTQTAEPELDQNPPATAAGKDPNSDRDKDGSEPAALPVHPRILDRQMQAALGRHLRAMFDDLANEPVPDKFAQLLQDLENKEKHR
jgi:hypothetical protein